MGVGDLLVSVIIKALNEERHIARCIRSALAAVEALGSPAEVILADSCSTDRTVEIASGFDIRVVQLQNPDDRCCGVGAQLGYQVALGEFVYILDGDMELDVHFLPVALQALRADAGLGGVAGLVQEMHVSSLEFSGRVARGSTSLAAADVATLNMGGLYRRSAVEQAGYLTNRNLHACEEFELGVRLVTQGWRLDRLGIPAVRHYGHTENSYRLLLRRWQTRYAFGHGELLRSALGQRHFWVTVLGMRVYRIQLALAVWWAVVLGLSIGMPSIAGLVLGAAALGLLALTAVMAWRKRSWRGALYAITTWHVGLAGLVRGLLLAPASAPTQPVPMRVLR